MRLPSGEVSTRRSTRSALARRTGDARAYVPSMRTRQGDAAVVREVQWQERLGESTYLYLGQRRRQRADGREGAREAHAEAGQRIAVCDACGSRCTCSMSRGRRSRAESPVADVAVSQAA